MRWRNRFGSAEFGHFVRSKIAEELLPLLRIVALDSVVVSSCYPIASPRGRNAVRFVVQRGPNAVQFAFPNY